MLLNVNVKRKRYVPFSLYPSSRLVLNAGSKNREQEMKAYQQYIMRRNEILKAQREGRYQTVYAAPSMPYGRPMYSSGYYGSPYGSRYGGYGGGYYGRPYGGMGAGGAGLGLLGGECSAVLDFCVRVELELIFNLIICFSRRSRRRKFTLLNIDMNSTQSQTTILAQLRKVNFTILFSILTTFCFYFSCIASFTSLLLNLSVSSNHTSFAGMLTLFRICPPSLLSRICLSKFESLGNSLVLPRRRQPD